MYQRQLSRNDEYTRRHIKGGSFSGMSDIFAGVTGFKFPDTQMNKGPLPTVVGGPAGSNGTPDAVINGTSSLLQNIKPYAQGESARMGSDSNYQQIPWRMQYIIPQLFIPSFEEYESNIAVSHAVDQGDIAFRLYTKDRAWFTSNSHAHTSLRPAALVCFGNLDIVNYILVCLQHSTSATWQSIRMHMHYDRDDDPHKRFTAIKRLVRQNFTPHGICAGSEHQGGKHEGSYAPIESGRAVNFVTTMTLDGKNEDLVNYWHQNQQLAGDTLIFKLEKISAKDMRLRNYQLTRYYKQAVRRSVHIPDDNAQSWQLVPHVYRVNDPVSATEPEFDYRVAGYWRIAQSFQFRHATNSAKMLMTGPLLEVTFAPVWMDFSLCRQPVRGPTVSVAQSPRRSVIQDDDNESNWSFVSEPVPVRGSDFRLPDMPSRKPAGKRKRPAGPDPDEGEAGPRPEGATTIAV